MKIKSLIKEAQVIKDSIIFPEGNVEYLMSLPGCTLSDRQKYEAWKNKCLIYFGNSRLDHDIIIRFKDSMKRFETLGFTPNYMDEMIGVLKAVEENEMVKKTKKNNTEKPVTKCDLSKEVVANCDHPEEVITNYDNSQEISLSQYDIEKLIVTVRGVQVLIDQDIAMLYGVTTKRLNEQAKRNIARFPSSFRFELTKDEMNEVVANCDHLQSLKFRPTLPYAFTEQGIGQLSSVVHSKIAIERSIMIMNAFVAMRRFMVQNAGILMRIAHLERHQIETDEKIDKILDRMDKQSPKLLPEQIFATGCVWDAWTYVSDLVRSAKQRIVLIDNYVDDCVLSLLDKRADNVEATIHSRYYEPFLTDLKKHNEQYCEIKFIQLSQKNHDRFLMIDDDVYLLGASVKDMGVGMCAVTKMQVSPETILQLLSVQ